MMKASLILALFVTLTPINTAFASASLIIKPTRVELNENDKIIAVNVQNQGTEDANIQLRLMNWSQKEGEDVYTDYEHFGLIACPSVFTIKAGESQIVRVGLEELDRNWNVEGTFRLFIQEIPPAPVEGVTAVQVAVRIGIPVFLLPKENLKPSLNWNIENRGDAGLWVKVSNGGNSHVLISAIQLKNDNGFLYEAPAHQYVLAGSSISWRVDGSKPIEQSVPANVSMLVASDKGVYQEEISLD